VAEEQTLLKAIPTTLSFKEETLGRKHVSKRKQTDARATISAQWDWSAERDEIVLSRLSKREQTALGRQKKENGTKGKSDCKREIQKGSKLSCVRGSFTLNHLQTFNA